MAEAAPRTLFDKVWDSHVVDRLEDGTCVLYIDRHLVHEVTSPQAFEGLRLAGRPVRRPDATIAVADHNVPTDGPPRRDRRAREPAAGRDARAQRRRFRRALLPRARRAPGHRPHHRPRAGAEPARLHHRLRRQPHLDARRARARSPSASARPRSSTCWRRRHCCRSRPRTCWSASTATLAAGCTAKDIVLAIIGRIGTAGGTGHVIEYAGEAIRALDMAGRMTVCNMSIEAGARAGMIAPDDTTFDYIRGKPYAPKGEAFDRAVEYWRTLPQRRGRPLRARRRDRRRRARADGDLGHQPRGRAADHRRRAGPGGRAGRGQARPARSACSTTWASTPGQKLADDPDRRRVHRLLHQRPHRGHPRRRRQSRAGATSHRACARWSCPAPAS